MLQISEGKHICLYGGEDMEWIRKFTKSFSAVARAAQIPLEMLYVGKSNPGEKVRKNNIAIAEENLSATLPDLSLMWFFWIRLESMWHSKVQHGRSVENDPIMQEIMTMLSFDGSDEGWAVVSKGSAKEMAKAKGETMLNSLGGFETWKEEAIEKGFVPAMISNLNDLSMPQHLKRLILPGTSGSCHSSMDLQRQGFSFKTNLIQFPSLLTAAT